MKNPWVFRKVLPKKERRRINLHTRFRERASFYQVSRATGTFCDGTLKTEEGGVFKIHRIIIASASKYFHAVFFSTLNTQIRETVLIPGVRKDILTEIINYAYACEANITSQNVCDLLIAADQLLFPDLVQQCQEFMVDNLNISNCLGFYALCKNLEHLSPLTMQLKLRCHRFIQINFCQIVKEPSVICNVSFDLLRDLLQDNKLNVREDVVWDAIVTWVSKDPFHRRNAVASLISCLRLWLLDSSYIFFNIINHSITRDNDFRDFVEMEFRKCWEKEFGEFPTPCSDTQVELLGKQRLPEEVVLYVQDNGTYDHDDVCRVYELYDTLFDCRREIGYKEEFWPETLSVLGECLIMFDLWWNTALSFNLISKEWTLIPPMNASRREFAAVAAGGKLYCIGGVSFMEEQLLTTVEAYNPIFDTWEEVKPMNLLVKEIKTETLKGKIYAIGILRHLINYPIKDIVVLQCYDPDLNSWKTLPSPLTQRRNFATVMHNEALYIIGGLVNDVETLIVEKFDVSENSWSEFHSICCPYRSPKALVSDGVLIVHENAFEEHHVFALSPPIYFDTTTSCWKKFESTSPWISLLLPKLHGQQYVHCVIKDKNIIQQLRSEIVGSVDED